MLTLPFYKVHPSGNMTCLFEGIHLNQLERKTIAAQALRQNHIDGEQAGFIDIDKGILHMAGGELCINATRCLGLLMALRAGCTAQGQKWQGKVQVSGMPDAHESLYMEVEKPCVQHTSPMAPASVVDAPHMVTLHMPMHPIPPMQEVEKGLVVVRMPGITHILLDITYHPFPKDGWKEKSAALRKKLQLEQELAVGCIWWKSLAPAESYAHMSDAGMTCTGTKNYTAQHLRIDPVVFVKNPPTECYENACGSGTLAVTLWLYTQNQQQSFVVQQPGGYLTVAFHSTEQQENRASALMAHIGGPVFVVAQGTAFFTMPT